MEGLEKNTLRKPIIDGDPHKSHPPGNAYFTKVDAPVLDSQININFDQQNNDDLSPPTLKLSEKETPFAPKDLIIKLSRQKLSPRQLVIQLSKLKRSEKLCNGETFLISGEHKAPYTCTLQTEGKNNYPKRVPPSIQCYACCDSFETLTFLKKHLIQWHSGK